MRELREIIIHCSATVEGIPFTVEDIRNWHRRRGMSDIGYHYVIHLDGTVHPGRPLERVGAHCTGHNTYSVGICYIGGLDRDGHPKNTMTEAQQRSLANLIRRLKAQYPSVTQLHGHNEYANKACPCFDVQRWARALAIA